MKKVIIKNLTCYYFDDIIKLEEFTHNFSHSLQKIRVNSYDSLPIEKRLTLHNVIIFIKSVLNKDYYYYKIFLEKCPYQIAKQ